MKNITLLIAFFFLVVQISFSQVRLHSERGIYTQGHINPILINPGATGFNDNHELLLNYRNTWASFPGSPKTMTFSYNGPIGNRIGVGVQVMNDQFASFQTLKALLSVAYSLESESNKVSFGIAGEYLSHKLDGEDILNPLVDQNDPDVLLRVDGSQFFDLSLGIYGVYDKKIVYGLTVPSLVSTMLNDFSNGVTGDKEIGVIGHLGYRHDIAKYDMVLEPSIILKYLMFTPTHVDLNLKAEFLDNTLVGGLNYTVGGEERLGFLVGVNIDNLGFYYSYNMSFQDFQQYNNGSHELSLKYNIPIVNRSK